MFLPQRFLKFFFPQALKFFARTWVHTISLIEEDLAVGLMFRLLFVPLFHDSSIVGRVLSFIFRLARVLLGLLAYGIASACIFALLALWFLGWALLFVPALKVWGLVYFGVVIALFIERLFYPQKTVREIYNKDPKALKPTDLWKATKLKPKDITIPNLLNSVEVASLLHNLETTKESFKSYDAPLTDQVLLNTLQLAWRFEARFIKPDHFFVALLFALPNFENDLLKLNLTLEDFEGALKFQEEKRKNQRMTLIWEDDFAVKHLKGVNRGWLGAPTPFLDSVSTDLTREAARMGFDSFIGRKEVVLEVINILSQARGKNALLVGPVGAGKSTLVKHLAKVIVSGDAPESFATKRLVSLDLSSLLAGVRTQGELAEKIKVVFSEVRRIGGIIIYLPQLQALGVGEASSAFNLYSLLLPEIESSDTQFLASTEPEHYSTIIQKDLSFASLFTKIEVLPASISDTIQILEDRAITLERFQKLPTTYLAIKTLANLSEEYIHDRCLPDSAITLFEECPVLARGAIDSKVVKEVIGKRVNIPIAEIGNDKKEELLKLEEIIHQSFIDQEEAVVKIANTLRRSATELREKNRPIGSFLFVGPTGVGKTELCKILAQEYFKNAAAFLRFDMSEYQTGESVNRLLGTVDSPGELTEAVKNKPYSLILLDEFEKADPRITTLFLQVLDDGRLTDARGVTVDFRNTIIIATSNAGSLLITQGLEKGSTIDALEEPVHEELLKIFKPELVNRFDSVVLFKPLAKADLEKIVTLKLNALKKQMKEKGYLVEFSPELISEIVEKGFDQSLGARPLRRFIQDTLEANLSKMILQNILLKGQAFLVGKELAQ